jgi:EAL domain-containing protein (putative c-di-GMP-specific phosphodiesterase class I)
MGDELGRVPGGLLESWLELRETLAERPGMERLLFDTVTGLPTMPLLFPRIEELLAERGEVSLLCLDIVRYSRIEEIYGWKVFDNVMRDVAGALVAITGSYIRESDTVAELMVFGNAFVIVLSPPRNTMHLVAEDRESLARRVELRVREHLHETMDAALYRKFGCYVGSSTVKSEPTARVERLVHDGLEKALAEACSREKADAEERRTRLEALIDDRAVHTLVHPLVDLRDLSVIGYEALSRGPQGGEFEMPDKLFKVAYDADLVIRLERLCRRSALQVASDLPDGRLLFVNVEPESISDPDLRESVLAGIAADVPLEPGRVVFEITERTAILDFPGFRASLDYLRALGFGIAVDDAGAGYGSLQCLAEIRPQWLKVDMSLVRGIDTDRVRRSLVEGLIAFANEIGGNIVAEGIERREELETLRELGVPYGQGFLFAHPSAPFPVDPVLA